MTTSTTDERIASPWTKRSDLWVLNPGLNIDICFDHQISRFVFTQKTYQFKRNMAIDPKKQMDFFARGRPWEALLVEYEGRVSLLFNHKKGWSRPIAAYPSWSFRDDSFDKLRKLCRGYPEPGEVVGTFWGDSVPYTCQPGQQRVILVRNMPADVFSWQQMMGFVSDMRRNYDVLFHFHGGKGAARTMGVSVDSFDHPVTIEWVDGMPSLLMPNGKTVKTGPGHSFYEYDHWAKLIGESLARFRRLKDRRELGRFTYQFNLKSLIWAEKNQEKLYAFQGRRLDGDVDSESSDEDWVPVLQKYRPRVTELGDKWLCDTCTIAHRCPYSRAGAVCIVDGTEASTLSEKFRSRKASDIIDGISALLGAQTERLEKALITEQNIADRTNEYRLSPQVTTLANGIFDRAIQMARLLDPAVAGQMANGRINVGIVNGNAGAVAQSTPQEIMAAVAGKLEEFGIPLAEATIEQVEAVMRGENPPVYPKAIETTFDVHDTDD